MKFKHRTLPKPTEAELELLRVLWEKGPSTVREVHEAVNQQRPVGYTSVLKIFQIMTEKGLVEREEAGKAHIYHAVVSQKATQNQMLRDLSERLFSGSAAQLAMHALSMEQASSEELDELRRLIEQKRKKQ
jgi:predicted transcriptional regulator